jgi:hypothetical protein
MSDYKMQIQETIIDQLGRGKFIAMTGAGSFVYIRRGIQFSFRGSKIANKCVITLDDGTDTYTIKFYKLNMLKGTCPLVSSRELVYADTLRDVFKAETGLDVTL